MPASQRSELAPQLRPARVPWDAGIYVFAFGAAGTLVRLGLLHLAGCYSDARPGAPPPRGPAWPGRLASSKEGMLAR